MSIKSTADGYLVDIRPQGRDGKRIRKRFKTKSEAQQYERWVLATQHDKEWLGRPADTRPLSELIELWWRLHGQTLKDGENTRRKLHNIDARLKHPQARHVTKAKFAEYRAARLESGRQPKTVNRDQEMLAGVFSTLIELGHYHHEHPLKEMKKVRLVAHEMGFLTRAEVPELLALLSDDNLGVVKVCLATGARWREAAELRREDVVSGRVTFVNTKNGKNRTVPISHSLYKEITSGISRGPLFKAPDYLVVRSAIKSVAPDLPAGQAVHVLRHTFASHFMMSGGNILALQKILGHHSIQQTMTYAHFAPDYLSDAVRFNPLEN
ncbi:integrase [Aeromonas veronii]|uniref:phage integrase n=1 Tax=Aeromonas veronii TaxID=654 RepID=UPI00078CDAE2|nr:tyrosine-type recombinase/integrase [Aeromonas veronii]AMQ44834.1 integrase [Aeromonas veronii]MCX0428006.1 tyrosine-type recombinase/integrase [Aeromonas veronii]MCX0447301.1 tyrosine-type recombinase/integrase [Aeromonas veronii]POG17278.1 integrase [Aeromonas veronii]